jgi:hypothetical protein
MRPGLNGRVCKPESRLQIILYGRRTGTSRARPGLIQVELAMSAHNREIGLGTVENTSSVYAHASLQKDCAADHFITVTFCVRLGGHGRGSGTEEICFLDVSVTQHGQIPVTDASRQGIASRASAAADDGEFRKRIMY